MRIGYTRVSTFYQSLALQRDALKAGGCEKILTHQGIGGSASNRPGLQRALKALQSGDALVAWKSAPP